MTESKEITIILIDEPYESDYRVLLSLQKYDNPIVINCNDFKIKFNILDILLSIKNIVKSTSMSYSYWNFLYRKYNIKPNGLFKGLKKSIQIDIKSRFIAKKILNQYSNIKLIHANDLFCGLIGKIISQKSNINFIYDAHEIEFHRNRKNGLIRVSYDIFLEKEVIKVSNQIIVVNKHIKQLYINLYNIPNNEITIIDNNHFTPYINYTLNNYSSKINEISILYIGGGILGRKLEALANDSSTLNLEINAFFLSKIPTFAYNKNWSIGPTTYLPTLLELIKVKKLIMWCCTDNLCLSYTLSLPNKFFQAISLGIPIIAYKNTYLASIVIKYNLGYVYNDNNLKDILNSLKQNDKYYSLLKSISLFQKKLFIEKLGL